MQHQQWVRNVRLLYCHAVAMSTLAFLAPTLVLYWRSHGVTLAEASILEAAFALILALFSLPNGLAADRIGRVRVIRQGNVLALVGMLFYCLADSFWGFLCGEVMLALGYASFGGATQAILTDSVRLGGRADKNAAKAIAITKSLLFSTWMIAAVIGGLLAEINDHLPFAASLTGVAIGLLIAFRLKEPVPEVATHQQETRPSSLKDLRVVLQNSSRLRALLGVSAVLAGLLHAGVVLFPPHFVECGMSPLAIGGLMASMHLVCAATARHLPMLHAEHGERPLLAASFAGIASGYLMLGSFVSPLAMMFVLCLQIARAYAETVLAVEVECAVPDGMRATVLGLRNTIDWLARCSMLLLSGVMAELLSPQAVFLTASVVAMLYGVRVALTVPGQKKA